MAEAQSVKRILVAEDDREIADVVVADLRDHGFEVEHTVSGRDTLARLQWGAYDLLILDLTLPDRDGLEICRSLRAQNDYCPILMLAARTSELDSILALDSGADDYMAKPFGMRELVARVKALLRRAGQREIRGEAPGAPVERFGLALDPVKRKVTLDGEPIRLTAKEFDLLLHLARHPGRVYTRAELLKSVWNYGHEGYEHTINSHINRLRSKIESDPLKPRYVRTVWGVGYKFPDDQDWNQA